MNVSTTTPPSSGGGSTWIFIIIIVFLLLALIGLAIWIFFLHRKPACTANAALCNSYCSTNCSTICPPNTNTTALVPYNIYGTDPSTCLTLNSNTFKGIMAQTNGSGTLSNAFPGSLQLVAATNSNNPLAQWYFIPTSTPGAIMIQNVGSKGYINISPGTSAATSAITIQNGISNATPVQWQINRSNNITYFVFVSPTNNGCQNNSQYIVFQENNLSVKMACVQGGVTGNNWFVNAATAGPVGPRPPP